MITKAKIVNGKIEIDYTQELDALVLFNEGDSLVLDIEFENDSRTLRQNNAMHLYFRLLADEFVSKGIGMKAFIRTEIDFTPDAIKNHLWKPLQEMIVGKKKTSQLTTDEVNKVYKQLDKIILERTGGEVNVPFPSVESMHS